MGLQPFGATVQRTDPVTGNQPSALCGTSSAAQMHLVLGEAVKIRRTTFGPCTPISSIPAHY